MGMVRRIREPWVWTRIAAWRKASVMGTGPKYPGGGPRTPIHGAAHGACWARATRLHCTRTRVM
ncbi:hypothetical protein OYB25_27275, partial [Escherichia coli]|nr:hypothetical protein [Escherichia coli]